jgi:hypothetical protein
MVIASDLPASSWFLILVCIAFSAVLLNSILRDGNEWGGSRTKPKPRNRKRKKRE